MLESKTEIMPLSSDCLAQLKLRQPPFDAVQSEEFLYSDPLLESLIETAVRALVAPGAVVILAGLDGSGRSLQLMRLLGALGDNFELIAFRGRAGIPFAAVDATIRNHLRAVGLDHPARSLKELLAERSRAGVALVLAIDDAHLIGMEIIDRLLRIRSEILEANGQGLRLILVGDPSLNRGRLPLPDPADENQVVRLNLRPLNLEQAGAYLRHRLRVAGIEDPETFLTSGDIAVLQTSSKGIPAALNANANAWLARRCRNVRGFRQAISGKIGHLVGQPSATSAHVDQVVVQGKNETTQSLKEPLSTNPEGILDLDGEDEVFQPTDPELARFLVREDERLDTSDFEQVLRQIRNNKLIPEALPTPAVKQDKAQSQSPIPYWNQRWFIPAILGIVVLSILIPVVMQLEHPSRRRSIETLDPSGAETAVEPLAEEIPVSATNADPARQTLMSESSVTAQPKSANGADSNAASEDGLPSSQTDVGDDVKESSNTTQQSGQSLVSEPASETALTPLPDPLTVTVSADLAADQDWLLRQDSGRFTIQLVAARNLEIATEFVTPHNLDGIHFIQTRSYVIALAGSYPSRDEAQRALPKLPSAVRANGPWIRTIGSVIESQR